MFIYDTLRSTGYRSISVIYILYTIGLDIDEQDYQSKSLLIWYTVYYIVVVREGILFISTQRYGKYENFVVAEYYILQGNQVVCYISVY